MKAWPDVFRTRDMIGEKIGLLRGRRNGDSDHSEGLHMLIAQHVPYPIIMEAIGATNDAVMRSKGPDGQRIGDPGAYFAGAVRNLCRQNGIETPIKWGDE